MQNISISVKLSFNTLQAYITPRPLPPELSSQSKHQTPNPNTQSSPQANDHPAPEIEQLPPSIDPTFIPTQATSSTHTHALDVRIQATPTQHTANDGLRPNRPRIRVPARQESWTGHAVIRSPRLAGTNAAPRFRNRRRRERRCHCSATPTWRSRGGRKTEEYRERNQCFVSYLLT